MSHQPLGNLRARLGKTGLPLQGYTRRVPNGDILIGYWVLKCLLHIRLVTAGFAHARTIGCLSLIPQEAAGISKSTPGPEAVSSVSGTDWRLGQENWLLQAPSPPMEGKVRHSLKGAIPYLATSPEQQGRPTLAQVTLLDPVPTLITATWQCQGASPQFVCGISSGGGRADLFQIAVQIHGHNHGSQLVGKEQAKGLYF